MELLQEKKGHKVKTIARGAAGILQLIEMKVQKGNTGKASRIILIK